MRTVIHGLFVAAVIGARNLHAQNSGTLTGRVTAADGTGLQGALVSVSGTVRVALARSDGSYQLTLAPGRYEVRTRLLGFAPAVDSVTIGDRSVTHNVTLQRVATSLESVAIIG